MNQVLSLPPLGSLPELPPDATDVCTPCVGTSPDCLLHGEPKRHVIVIGYGNTLRGDDGIGPGVADALVGKFDEQHFEALALPLLSPELVLNLARTRSVLFIDADCSLPQLTWKVDPILPQCMEPSPFSCHVRPEALLFWTQWLFGRCPEAKFLRIGARYFDFDERLSVEMTRLLPQLTTVAESVIGQWLRAGSCMHSHLHEAEARP